MIAVKGQGSSQVVAGAASGTRIANTAGTATGGRIIMPDDPSSRRPINTLPSLNEIAETIDQLQAARGDLKGMQGQLGRMGV